MGSYGRVLYNYFRDYEPDTGRYVQSDPIGIHGGVNRYTYVHSSPIYGFDPFGLCDISGRWAQPPRLDDWGPIVCPRGYHACLTLKVDGIYGRVGIWGQFSWIIECEKDCGCPEDDDSWLLFGSLKASGETDVPLPIPKPCLKKFLPPPARKACMLMKYQELHRKLESFAYDIKPGFEAGILLMINISVNPDLWCKGRKWDAPDFNLEVEFEF